MMKKAGIGTFKAKKYYRQKNCRIGVYFARVVLPGISSLSNV